MFNRLRTDILNSFRQLPTDKSSTVKWGNHIEQFIFVFAAREAGHPVNTTMARVICAVTTIQMTGRFYVTS